MAIPILLSVIRMAILGPVMAALPFVGGGTSRGRCRYFVRQVGFWARSISIREFISQRVKVQLFCSSWAPGRISME